MSVRIMVGDVRERLAELPDESVHCVVTSPPYWGLRDYGTGEWEGGDEGCGHRRPGPKDSSAATPQDGYNVGFRHGSGDTDHANEPYRDVCRDCGARRVDRQLGLEATVEEWVAGMVDVFREVRRVLRRDGTCWVNLGDSYGGGACGGGSVFDNGRTDGRASNDSDMPRGREATTRRPAGMGAKQLIGQPWRLAFALQADGWWLRSDIIWSKPNPMPESCTDRPTKSHEYVFLLTRSPRYFYDADAVREAVTGGAHARGDGVNPKATAPGTGVKQNQSFSAAVNELVSNRNLRSVWRIPTQPYPAAHFATYPEKLVEPCIRAGTSERGCCRECGAQWVRVMGDAVDPWRPTCEHDGEPIPCTVLDPFGGSGTTGYVAARLGRDAVLVELNPEYAELARSRCETAAPLFSTTALL